jgi:hypothetical protein
LLTVNYRENFKQQPRRRTEAKCREKNHATGPLDTPTKTTRSGLQSSRRFSRESFYIIGVS